MHKEYNKIWESFLESNYFPIFLRNVDIIEYSEFEDSVYNNFENTASMIDGMLRGDAYILKNALPKETAKQIKNDIFNNQNLILKSDKDIRIDREIDNYHLESHGGGGGGYKEIGHTYYFFRWNEDKFRIFERIEKIWNTIKVFNGLDDSIKFNKPKDKIIDRIQVLQYPINSGEITPHCDVARWQKTNVGFNLTQIHEDFDSGGFYCLNSSEQKVKIEPLVEAGDIVFWIPTIFHGVETPISNSNVDWSTPEGRWQLLAFSIQSHCVKNRVISCSYDNFKLKTKEILDNYLFKDGVN